MTNRSPGFIFFFILSLALCLFAVSFLFPSGKIDLPFGLTFKYPSTRLILGIDKPNYRDISETVILADSIHESIEMDSGFSVFESQSLDSVQWVNHFKRINVDSLRAAEKYIQPLEFKDGNTAVLYKFFEALNQAALTGRKTHVFHYGDSQIEGDRMTSYIRDRLQKRIGGYGIGMVSASNQDVVPILRQENSDSWNRYPLFSPKGDSAKSDKYGAMCSYSAYSPYPVDSSFKDSAFIVARINLNTSKSIYNSAKKFRQVRLFYGPVFDPVKLTFPINDTVFSDFLNGKEALNSVKLDFNEPLDQIELHFESRISPQIYGISLEGSGGVQVSNIAMRGSSGTVFHKMDRALFSEMHQELNTSLIILQYGGNVLPYLKDEAQANDYGRYFYNQLRIVQAACPNTSIVVIGPADMSQKTESYYESYPLIPNVRDALKEAAFKAGAAYWDMYEAMGGENSMPSWVEADPPLAGTDYTHFTPRGARIISEFFYKALIIEYETYNQNQANEDSK